eukprot:CAMPEP_0116146788 /NCGR_PEP_ID=MMETSP0329-20121206/17359_1 /TAXON_ID=697910 /ORGANISM="Pseudo-nitzschia arenysensis, Strain B593" /LENGTH=56 /DNA_ID=CAMNT_0003642575 /DNA_START=1 /DNA_END=167 /DNA_ORIENTATION=-
MEQKMASNLDKYLEDDLAALDGELLGMKLGDTLGEELGLELGNTLGEELGLVLGLE